MAWGSEVQVSSLYEVPQHPIGNGIYVGRAGDIITAAHDTSNTFTGRKSTDSGASFAAFSTPDISGGGLPNWIHFPWHNNSQELICYYGSILFVSGQTYTQNLYRVNGTTKTDITPQDSSGRNYITRFPRSITTPDNNNLRVALAGTNSDPFGIARNAFFVSDDGGASWVQVTTEVADTAYTGVHVAESGLVYAWGSNLLGVAQFADLLAGGGFDSRFGDLGAAEILNIMGG